MFPPVGSQPEQGITRRGTAQYDIRQTTDLTVLNNTGQYRCKQYRTISVNTGIGIYIIIIKHHIVTTSPQNMNDVLIIKIIKMKNNYFKNLEILIPIPPAIKF